MQRERDRLLAECTQFLSSGGTRPRAVVVRGEAGIGKSTFVDLLHAEALARGCTDVVSIDDADSMSTEQVEQLRAQMAGNRDARLILASRAFPASLEVLVDRTFERRLVSMPGLERAAGRDLLADLGHAPWSVFAAQVLDGAAGNPRVLIDLSFAMSLDVTTIGDRSFDDELLPRGIAGWLHARMVDGSERCRHIVDAATRVVADPTAEEPLVEGRADALAVLAEQYLSDGQLEDAVQASAMAGAMPEHQSDVYARRWATLVGSAARASRGEATAMLSLHALAGIAARARMSMLEIRAWQFVCGAAGHGGDVTTARRATTRGIELADSVGATSLGLQQRIAISQLHLAANEPGLAKQYAEETAQVAGALGYHVLHADALMLMARSHLLEGDVEQARAAADDAMQLAIRQDLGHEVLVDIRIAAARACAASGDPTLAIAALGDPAAASARLGYWVALEAIRVMSTAPSIEGARDLGHWYAILDSVAPDADGGAPRAARAESEAWAAWRAGRRAEAARLAQRARQLWTEAECHEELPLTDVLLAAAPVEQGPRTSLVGDLTEPGAPRDPVAFDALTPREREIARYVAGGLTNPEIAGELHLSPRTVEHHVASILRKLELPSRRELVRGRV